LEPTPNLNVEILGECKIPSPLALSTADNDLVPNFIVPGERVFLHGKAVTDDVDLSLAFEAAGPRDRIYFDPRKTRAGIVTCGGLCPGINNVIIAIVNELVSGYGLKTVTGFRYGYAGMVASEGYETVALTPEMVADWNLKGGSMLGSSRGNQDTEEMVDALERLSINVLFTIGGDGTQRGAMAIHEEAKRRGYRLAVVGVPKTIDNDINFITRTFGFETAVSKATEAIHAALVEAQGAPRGVGLVRLMGRHSGYIAAHASLAAGNVDCTLIPEVPFALEPFFAHVDKVLKAKNHMVIVVAEGAGQELMHGDAPQYDASGNKKLLNVGTFLGDAIKSHFAAAGAPVNLKYIDPSYIIRATPASPADAIFCRRLGQNAVHAAMAGRTGVVVGIWSDHFTHVPLTAAVGNRKVIDTDGHLWGSVLLMTGQPPVFS